MISDRSHEVTVYRIQYEVVLRCNCEKKEAITETV